MQKIIFYYNLKIPKVPSSASQCIGKKLFNFDILEHVIILCHAS